ncbi:DUF6766 family protein [Deinococcus alpinitundrae]|uniref:DUF6766 family protein n=1 Tax=Deinococcus alpinitundrae TaxID=468913 RepID=UPI00137A25F4|nr:DUF6766 family protein [Deinococcus alpinitundrae]
MSTNPSSGALDERKPPQGLRRFWAENALSIVVFSCFLLFWLAQALTGWANFNEDQLPHHQTAVPFLQYLKSSEFWSATAENWESEFLQMGVYVILTIYLKQRGSADSNPYPDEDTDEKPLDPAQAPGPVKRRGWILALYRNSLSLTLLTLFGGAMLLHAVASHHVFNHEQQLHGEHPVSFLTFLGKPDFWFQSFQNWQSEFLAIGTLVVLTIFLRQIGSSQSKAVEAPHRQTGD